jgi:ribosomal protein L19E
MALGRKTGGGSRKGRRNKRTIDGEAYARAIVEDETVRAQILNMARDGSLSPDLVKTFLAYAFGKPVEVVDNGDSESPRTIQITF